ncbi:hypothetical protein Syun_019714 [Stephania yunnanensis]|uniref:Uncharacterized protein n=1 Tax=Stephania yunnanensis TaxID=152371 RepID=A0AAP0IUJ6_9MAGN
MKETKGLKQIESFVKAIKASVAPNTITRRITLSSSSSSSSSKNSTISDELELEEKSLCRNEGISIPCAEALIVEMPDLQLIICLVMMDDNEEEHREELHDPTGIPAELTMEKFENVDYNELGFDPHTYGLLTDLLLAVTSFFHQSICSRKEVEVRFPITSGTSNFPVDYIKADEEKIKITKWQKEIICDDMKREQLVLNLVKQDSDSKKKLLVSFLSKSSSYA